MTKLELVLRAEAQLKAAYPNRAPESFRSWKWRVGVIQQDIVVRGRLAFSKGESVLFTVTDQIRDLPVQAFSFKNNIVTGLFFNDIREMDPRDNSDLTELDFSTLKALRTEDILTWLPRTIFSDILQAQTIHRTGTDEGVPLTDKNEAALIQMALRPGRIPDDEEVAYHFLGEGYVVSPSGTRQAMKMVDLMGAKPLDGRYWMLDLGILLRLK